MAGQLASLKGETHSWLRDPAMPDTIWKLARALWVSPEELIYERPDNRGCRGLHSGPFLEYVGSP